MTILRIGLCLFISVVLCLAFFVFYRMNSRSSTQNTLEAKQNLIGDLTRNTSAIGKRNIERNRRIEETDPWRIWIDEKTEQFVQNELEARKKAYPFADPPTSSQIARMRRRSRDTLENHASEMMKKYVSPAEMEAAGSGISREVTFKDNEPEKYNGLQTVDALMEAYDKSYRQGSIDDSMEAKYPRDKWLGMLLDKGLRVDDYSDYSLYMNMRTNLMHLEHQPEAWASGDSGIPPTDDWETFKSAYIDRKVWEHQQIYKARQEDPRVWTGYFMGPDQRTFLPGISGRVYVERHESSAFFFGTPLADEQRSDILNHGQHPEGYDIVYIDRNGNILSDSTLPQPTAEEGYRYPDSRVAPQNPSSETSADATHSGDDRSASPQNNYESTDNNHQSLQEAQEQFERVLAEFLEHATITDAEFEAALEKQNTPETAVENSARLTEDEIETGLDERFSPERIHQAQQILSQYGPEEGLARLREVDPDMAEHTTQKLNRNRETTDAEPSQ